MGSGGGGLHSFHKLRKLSTRSKFPFTIKKIFIRFICLSKEQSKQLIRVIKLNINCLKKSANLPIYYSLPTTYLKIIGPKKLFSGGLFL